MYINVLNAVRECTKQTLNNSKPCHVQSAERKMNYGMEDLPWYCGIDFLPVTMRVDGSVFDIHPEIEAKLLSTDAVLLAVDSP